MKKLSMIVIAFLLASFSAVAQDSTSHQQHLEHMRFTAVEQDWAKQRADKSPRHQEWVAVKYGNRTVNCLIVFPEVKNKATAVIVIHEIFGMSDWVRSLTDQWLRPATSLSSRPAFGDGSEGRRVERIDRSGIGQAIRDLPPDQVTGDLNAAADSYQAAGLQRQGCSVGFLLRREPDISALRPTARAESAFVFFYGTGRMIRRPSPGSSVRLRFLWRQRRARKPDDTQAKS